MSDSLPCGLSVSKGGACRHLRGARQRCSGPDDDLTLSEVDAARDPALARALNLFRLPSMFPCREADFHSEPRPEKLPAAIEAALRKSPS